MTFKVNFRISGNGATEQFENFGDLLNELNSRTRQNYSKEQLKNILNEAFEASAIPELHGCYIEFYKSAIM